MDIKEFWRQYEISDKQYKKWAKRADKVIERYRLETGSGDVKDNPTFNILWANTSVIQPGLFSQVPKPDITRRYKDEDPVARQGALVIERGLEFVMDDGDFYTFGKQSVLDYLLPGMTVPKIRYVPLYAKTTRSIPLESRWELLPSGTDEGFRYYRDDEEVDPSEIVFREGEAFVDEEIEEIVDEHVVIERWPWKNFRHQKARRWQDVGWVDFISYLDRNQLRKRFGRKASDIELTVDGSGDPDKQDGEFEATHAEIHEVWFAREKKLRVAAKGGDKWIKQGGDPLKLKDFYPCPRPLMAVDTNDSLQPIPLFTLYQHQANELDSITKRISVLMKALKLAGLYAGSEKDTLQKLFESDENQMIAVADWHAIKDQGGISGLVDWLPIEQVGKVLTALFREREQIVAQIFELTGIADIQRGSTDPRETKGSQVIKAQFATRRTLTPKQEVERYFRDVLRIAAEIMAEHFSADTLQRITGLEVSPEVRELLQDQLQRQYRIDIETDSTVAPDEEREQQNLAKAMQAITAYVRTIAPLVQEGVIDQRAAVRLLRIYLRKFRWGREMEALLDEIERNPQPQKPSAEERKAQAEQQKAMLEFQMKQQEHQQKMAERQAELQAEQQKAMLELRGMVMELQLKAKEKQQDLEQDREAHAQKLAQQEELARAKTLQVRQADETRRTA